MVLFVIGFVVGCVVGGLGLAWIASSAIRLPW